MNNAYLLNNNEINEWARQIARYIDENEIEGDPHYSWWSEYGDFEVYLTYTSEIGEDVAPYAKGFRIIEQYIEVQLSGYSGDADLTAIEQQRIETQLERMLN